METFPIPPTEYNTGKLFNIDTLPPSYASFSSNPQLRDFSFSSFLEPIPDNQPVKHTATASTLPGRTSDDLEISIFSAEKYFNTSPEHTPGVLPVKKGYFWNSAVQKPPRYPEFPQYPTTKRASSVSSAEGYGRNYRCTPTSTSEASWNSQSGLLTNPPGSIPFSLQEAPDRPKSTGKWRFGRKFPCLGKKSIEVDDNYVQTPKTFSGQNSPKFFNCRKPAYSPISPELMKTAVLKGRPLPDGGLSAVYEPQIRCKGESGRHVSLPGMNYRREDPNLSFPAPTIPAKLPADELGRKSLEVFRGHAGPTGLLIEDRRNLVLPGGLKDDDACSDASSDLFEIESFSTATTSYRRTPRHSLDDLASDVAGPTSIPAAGMYHLRRSVDTVAAPSECAYAPSEVSVEWSVTTAEGGFDHASFANFSTTGASESGGDIGRWSDHAKGAAALAKKGDLFGCHSQKSVSVFVPPVRNPPEMRAPTALGMAKRSDGGSLDVVDPSHVRKGVYRPSILRPHYPQVVATHVSS